MANGVVEVGVRVAVVRAVDSLAAEVATAAHPPEPQVGSSEVAVREGREAVERKVVAQRAVVERAAAERAVKRVEAKAAERAVDIAVVMKEDGSAVASAAMPRTVVYMEALAVGRRAAASRVACGVRAATRVAACWVVAREAVVRVAARVVVCRAAMRAVVARVVVVRGVAARGVAARAVAAREVVQAAARWM